MSAFISRLTAAAIVLVCALVTGSAAQAAFPGANGKVTGSWNSVITANYDGTNPQTLTPGEEAEWSADGARLVFQKFHYPTGGISIINADGTGEHQIHPSGRWPTWSPDGSKIAFSSSGADDLHVMNSDGTGDHVIAAGGTLGCRTLGWPRWSADGSKIAYVAECPANSGYRLETINPDGTARQVVVPPPVDAGERIDWTPDSSRIAFVRFVPQGQFGTDYIHLVNRDGTNITNTGIRGVRPVFSPDGTRIAAYERIYTLDGQLVSTLPPEPGGRIFHTTSWQPLVENGANLTVRKRDSVDPVYQGERFDYSIVVDHVSGSSPATNAVMTDTIPAGLALLGVTTSQGACSTSGANVNCQLGNIAPGGRATITVRVEASGSSGVTNTAHVSSQTSDPDTLNNSFSETTSITPVSGYVRPKGATPAAFSLVPAFVKCAAPDRTHGPPLAFGSCSSPAQSSHYVTIGTPDANGRTSNFVGRARASVLTGNPQTSADEADVRYVVSMTDIRNNRSLTDYTGQLQVVSTIRITDKTNGNPPVFPATMTDYPLKFVVPCVGTASTAIGATCSTTTSIDALMPGAVQEGRRGIWAFDQVKVFDGGEDGVVATEDNNLFATPGLFVP